MNFFWPTHLKSDPGIVARLGRIFHWLAVIAVVFMAYFGLRRPPDEWLTTELIGTPFVYFAGRGLRYLFAGE